MLESIKVTERLHWPEEEMSKKYILNYGGKAVSPSQVYLEKVSSTVLKDLLSAGSNSYNVLLQAEEEEKKSQKQSPYKRPKTSVKCGVTFSKRNRPGIALRKARVPESGSKPAQTNRGLSSSHSSLLKPARNISVVGNTMGLNPRAAPQLRKTCVPNSPRTKLPSLHKATVSREVENAKKLCILTAIKPSNVEREKAKFFKSDFSYNPQFEYSNPVSPLVLARHNNASDRFLTQILVACVTKMVALWIPAVLSLISVTCVKQVSSTAISHRQFNIVIFSSLVGSPHHGACPAEIRHLREV
uniref:Uncharacterized protein n=1 Tax=Acanthochromis polyacanthus TaxID=80966 RepID=A0A3Q1FD37_9TELE